MFTAQRKIKKSKDEKPTDLEKKVAQAIFDLELNSKDLKSTLQALYFLSAKELAVTKRSKCIVVTVPERQDKEFKRINTRLVRELEKKFSGRHVVIVPSRRAYKENKNPSSIVPRRRTFTAFKNDTLDDVVYPVDVTGKRTRVRIDGTKFITIKLDAKKKDNYECKSQTYGAVYKMLTGIRVKFEY